MSLDTGLLVDGGSSSGDVLLWEGQKCYSAATPVTEQSSSGSHLLSSSEEGHRKSDPIIDCPTLSWPENRIRRDYHNLVEPNEIIEL